MAGRQPRSDVRTALGTANYELRRPPLAVDKHEITKQVHRQIQIARHNGAAVPDREQQTTNHEPPVDARTRAPLS